MSNLVLIRHGESTWNHENRFTGWTDVDLTKHGIEEAHRAAQLLKDGGYSFDISFTSFLKRAIRTLWIILDDMNMMWIPIHGSWRLNERHYGALQGLNKAETAEKYGEAQVHIWRRSFSVKPPALEIKDMRWPGHDPRYQTLNKKDIPVTECLKDTVDRFLPYWKNTIAPAIIAGQKVIIAAHGNTLRALVMHLDHISDDEIAEFDIPTGIPLVYELNDELKPISHHYLGDPDQVKKATDAVGKQGSVLR